MSEPTSTESAARPPGPPPKWKFATIVLMAICPLLLIVVPVMGLIFRDIPYLGVPIAIGPEFFVRTLVTAMILVSLMVWVAIPFLTRIFRGWLESG